ncbi:DUF2029 domain-containing protein [Candidatus Sumerlaeota bacterium]|nr:DUF2029 domain-containing protein [Candidatus Sumerlaeota bacterium]
MATASREVTVQQARWFQRPQGRMMGWITLACVLACYVVLQMMPLLGTRGTGIAGLASHQNDFKHVYLGSILLSRDLSPYDANTMRPLAASMMEEDPRFRTILPYVYLPFTGIVMKPIASMKFSRAVVAFQVVNHMCILGSVVLAAFALGRLGSPWTLTVLLALSTFNIAVFRQNNAGQLNAILLFGSTLVFAAMMRGWHDALIGAIAAFLMLFKLSPGIFLIWFLLRGEWKRAAWMVAFAILFTAITVGTHGLKVHMEFISVLKQMGYGKSTWQDLGNTFWRDPYNQSINALFHRLLVPHKGSGITPWTSLSPAVANAFTWAATAGVLAVFVRISRRNNAPPAAGFSAAICAGLLAPAIMWDHYLTQLIVPFAILMFEAFRLGKWTMIATLLAGVALMAVPAALDQVAFRSGPGLLLMSMKLLPVILCLACAYVLSSCGAAGDEQTP